MSFAMAIASKGLSNKTIDLPTKQLRTLCCFGFSDIKPCHHLKKSNNSKYYYCGGCGCGDKEKTWLLRETGQYSKLDYPILNCPLKMPGFSNYDPNYFTNESKNRKEKITNFNPENLKYIQVTVNTNPLIEKSIDDINKIIKNS
jgi:hypothetical protein